MSVPICPVVALLGAGASIDAGLLSSIELTNALIDAVEKENDLTQRRALGMILGGIALQRGVDGELRQLPDRPDIETVLRVAHQLEMRATHPLAGYVSVWLGALEQLAPASDGTVFRRLNQRALEVIKDKLRTPDGTRVKYLSGLSRLGRPWADSGGAAPYPQIFTLNYDLCLETALEYQDFPYTTGFDRGLWTTSSFQSADHVRVYKLHGSFGWIRDPQTQLLYDRDSALERKDVIFLSDDTPDEIVFATENKMRALQPYLWMIHQFSEAIAVSKYVLVVGYSFGDEYVNQIVGQAMALDPSKRLLVVSPHFDPAQIERAKGMTMTYYKERVIPITQTAKEALHEHDTVLKEIQRLEAETRTEAPF